MFVAVAAFDNVKRDQVTTVPTSISTQEGESILLLCKIDKPIFSCRFYVAGLNEEIKLSPSWLRTDNFGYFGAGLSHGECGMIIKNVTEKYTGSAKCHLDENVGKLDAVGTIEIAVVKAAQQPDIEVAANRNGSKILHEYPFYIEY